MGSNVGNSMGGSDMGGLAGVRPFATEYTLQGVMRFLQTEWHRHERERNSWEIERQELKGRVATLEGQARRADVTQSALKKYVGILERKIKNQSTNGHNDGADDVSVTVDKAAKRAAILESKLKSSAVALAEPIDVDDEPLRADVKEILDQCQSEFTYLMVTPANPPAPRDSPPLPINGNEAEAYQMNPYGAHDNSQHQQQHQQHQQPPRQPPVAHIQKQPPENSNEASSWNWRQGELSSQPMTRSGPSSTSWGNNNQTGNDDNKALNHQGPTESEKKAAAAADDWDFPDTSTTPAQNRSETDAFPTAESIPRSPSRGAAGSHRRKGSMGRRKSSDADPSSLNNPHVLPLTSLNKSEPGHFKLRYGLHGHLNTVRTVIFSGGGSPAEPEICTGADDGLIKRFNVPQTDMVSGSIADLDVSASFTHRGHKGAVLSLAAWSPSPNFATGGRALGDGWIFSGGQDSTIRVWERGRVDPKATITGHTDAVWTMRVLPGHLGNIFPDFAKHGGPDRLVLVTGSADGTIKVWSVSSPPSVASNKLPGGQRPSGRTRNNSMSSGSAFPMSPQPTTTTFSNAPFNYALIHTIERPADSMASPTNITSLDPVGEAFVVSYSDATVLVYDTRTGEQVGSCASQETYDGTIGTSVNAVVATTASLDQSTSPVGNEEEGTGATGSRGSAGSGVEGIIISGHEDKFVRFYDANSGQCTYTMWAHPTAVSSLSLSPDGRELVSSGHDASLRFWNLEKRVCTQEITSHRIMRGEGICSVIWSQDGKWVVSAGGDGIVRVFAR